MKKGTGETIWDIKKQIGYFTPAMIQQFKKHDSVENMIISGLMDSVGLYVQPTDLQKDLAQSWLRMLGDSFYGKTFQQLSLGQQRMVMVVRALIKHPPLLILDEPTIELDEANSQLFIDMINKIVAEKKISIIYVSHRDELDLKPEKIFELKKSNFGFTGVVTRNNPLKFVPIN
jgi:molybdate transport system ATP-binding protein